MNTEYHFVITVSKPGLVAGTFYGVIQVTPGMTRAQIFQQAKDYAASQDPNLAGGNVEFFDVQPNQL